MLDRAALGPAPAAQAEALFGAGVDWIQLRDRALGGAGLYALACACVAARDAARRAHAHAGAGAGAGAGAERSVIVNKRLDVALAAGADGVHLGLDGLAPESADSVWRRLADADPAGVFRIGRSLHGLDELDALLEAARGATRPCAYVHLAPIWLPRSKPAERPALGLVVLAEAAARAAQAGIRVIAQGGLDAERAGEAIAAGASGIAVTGVLGRGSEAVAAAGRLRAALDTAAARTRSAGAPAHG